MQLYARDTTGNICNIHQAKKGNDYFCLECNGRVRVRSSRFLRAHYYHIQDTASCRQAGKTQEHIAIQRLIQQQIGPEACVEEMRFDSIGRIADVAWLEKKLIFEVQCSPISELEVAQRNRDYASCGWDVVWILYDATFNRKTLSAAELFLLSHSHYFSDSKIIYDQLHVVKKNRRLLFLDARPIQIEKVSPITYVNTHHGLLNELHKRFFSWNYYVEGDYLWTAVNVLDPDNAWKKATRIAESYEKHFGTSYYLNGIIMALGRSIRALWHVVLERCCS